MSVNQVLLVDDEDVIRLTMSLMLKKMGVTVVAVSRGDEAIDYYKEHMSEIDLVILDSHMPEISGLELFHVLKEFNPDITAVVSSGFLNDSERQEFEGIGIRGMLNKPFSMQDLKALLESLDA